MPVFEGSVHNAWERLTPDEVLTTRAASNRREFPSEFLKKTIEQIREIAKGKGEAARRAKKALKLLNDGREKFCK